MAKSKFSKYIESKHEENISDLILTFSSCIFSQKDCSLSIALFQLSIDLKCHKISVCLGHQSCQVMKFG